MIFALLTLFIALSISGVAAYYSIVGLMAIFSSAKIPIAIMGGVLEIGKLIVASWTFRNWKTSPFLIKFYFVFAAIVLMIITSLGIFGFLSRAHLEQTNPVVIMEQSVLELDSMIYQKEEQKNRLMQSVNKLDIAFERYVELGAVTKGMKSLEETEQQRKLIDDKIEKIQNDIDKLKSEKFDFQNKIKLTEIEVGPIKYIANLVYDEVDKNQLEDAVRIVIVLLVLVFDPLAIMLVIAANISLLQFKKDDSVMLENIGQTNNTEEMIVKKEKIQEIKTDEIIDDQIKVVDNKWKVEEWKDKGFRSPKAYMSFLKKFS
jgi:hypothetical protein